jgi:hypothetical protein
MIINLDLNCYEITGQILKLKNLNILCIYHINQDDMSRKLLKSEHICVSAISCDAIHSKYSIINCDDRRRFSKLPNNRMTIVFLVMITHSLGTNTMNKPTLLPNQKLIFTPLIAGCFIF